MLWSWLAQILEHNSSCNRALSFVQAWSQELGLPIPASDTSGFCAARRRLDIGFLEAVHARTQQHLRSAVTGSDLWKGHPLKAIDGTSVTLMDTPLNQQNHPQHPLSKAGCGFPIMGFVGITDLSHGGWQHFETCNGKEHDAKVASRMVDHIEENELVLADRAFCSYELIARIISERKGHVLMRLHQSRHRALDWKKGKKLSAIDRLFTWCKPHNKPPKSPLSIQQWKALPSQLELRLTKVNYEDRSGKKSELIVVSDLLDPHRYGGLELADLYARRWDVEVKFRDVKTTLAMEHFAVKSPEMARKTLLMMGIAYNLLCVLIQRASHHSCRPLNHFSFKGCLDIVRSMQGNFWDLARRNTQKQRAQIREQLIEICATKTLNIRPFRREPRAVKRRPKSYQLLTKHRHEFQEIPHRGEHYRKPRKLA